MEDYEFNVDEKISMMIGRSDSSNDEADEDD